MTTKTIIPTAVFHSWRSSLLTCPSCVSSRPSTTRFSPASKCPPGIYDIEKRGEPTEITQNQIGKLITTGSSDSSKPLYWAFPKQAFDKEEVNQNPDGPFTIRTVKWKPVDGLSFPKDPSKPNPPWAEQRWKLLTLGLNGATGINTLARRDKRCLLAMVTPAGKDLVTDIPEALRFRQVLNLLSLTPTSEEKDTTTYSNYINATYVVRLVLDMFKRKVCAVHPTETTPGK
ncbi:hypothetical protein PG997_011723 [Apiospora hydei]|uniref:Uncharacterized protein n=1 Tax=Apiospora hydei TaxID=1337664 RepID=A0ABR1V1A6_9PEZI